MVEIVGVAPGTRIARGQFFRATWVLNTWSFLLHEQLELDVFRTTYENITRTKLAMPVSELEVTAGDKSMVVDLLAWPAAEGMTVSQFAAALDAIRISLRLRSLELIDRATIDDHESRAAAQDLANSEKDWMKKLADQFTYLKWVLVLIVIAAALYAGSRAVGAWKGK